MDLLNQISKIINILFELTNSVLFFGIMILFIVIYQLIVYFLRDRIHYRSLKKIKDPEISSIKDLKYIPLLNIIIPVWNEGNEFFECLSSVVNLSYPKLKIIVNAGGNEETINISNSFQKIQQFYHYKAIKR